MVHLKPIFSKFIIYTIITSLILLFYGFSIFFIVLLSTFLAIVTYVIGDMVVLPLRGNGFATVVDGVLVLLIVLLWTASSYGLYLSIIAGAVFIAVLAAVCEWFIHIYVIAKKNRDDQEPIYE